LLALHGRTSKPVTPQPSRARSRPPAAPATPRAEHEHLRRRHRPRGRHLHRGKGGQELGRPAASHCSRDRSPATRAVYRLRACDPRDRLHRERDYAALRQPLDSLRVGQRLQESDQDLPSRRRATSSATASAPSRPRPCPTRRRRRSARPPLVAASGTRRPHRRRARRAPRSRWARGLADELRDERDPTLAGGGLLRHPDPHAAGMLFPGGDTPYA
jgi:hypothetical protein